MHRLRGVYSNKTKLKCIATLNAPYGMLNDPSQLRFIKTTLKKTHTHSTTPRKKGGSDVRTCRVFDPILAQSIHIHLSCHDQSPRRICAAHAHFCNSLCQKFETKNMNDFQLNGNTAVNLIPWLQTGNLLHIDRKEWYLDGSIAIHTFCTPTTAIHSRPNKH